MQKKSLDISQVLTDFRGEPIKESGQDLTLKTVLLVYIMIAHNMNVLKGKEENAHVYAAGQKIGQGDRKIELTDYQIDLLKKLVEHNKVRGGGQEVPMYGLVVSEQLLDMLGKAEVVKEKAK